MKGSSRELRGTRGAKGHKTSVRLIDSQGGARDPCNELHMVSVPFGCRSEEVRASSRAGIRPSCGTSGQVPNALRRKRAVSQNTLLANEEEKHHKTADEQLVWAAADSCLSFCDVVESARWMHACTVETKPCIFEAEA